MEKQINPSINTVRFLVFSSTTLFSLVFLIFLCSWVFESSPPSPSSLLGQHSLDSLTAQSLGQFSNSSSENVPKGSVLDKTHPGKEDVSSQVAQFPAANSSFRPSIEALAVDSAKNGSSSKVVPSNSSSGKRNQSKTERRKIACDITKGKWVLDETYPLYNGRNCPFIDEGFNCEGNGRPDKGYMGWRWQPQSCDIPRFNGTNMLELIRGKRMVFVGDSMNRNQWESMLCLLISAVKDPKKVYEARGRAITKERGNYCFNFEDYKCTVEYYVSHFLTRESKARVGKKRVQTLHIDAIDKSSSRWRGADIIVFNTAHWWSHSKTKAGINYYQEGDTVHPQLDVRTAYRRSLSTWASWIDKNINPRKTRVFFRSSSPSHFSGGQWNNGGHCGESIEPTDEASFSSEYLEKNVIVEEVLSGMKNRVTLLNVTGLSSYRVDAHPSIYGRRGVSGSQDCSHWCLPGVPDTWNELLYFQIHSK